MEEDDSSCQSADLVFIKTDSTFVPAIADHDLESELVVQMSRQGKGSGHEQIEVCPGRVVAEEYSLHHNRVGGVTDGEFNVTVSCKGKYIDPPLCLLQSVPNVLGDMLSGVVTGSCCKRPLPGQPNLACGLILLDNVSTTEVVTPYVKKKDQFAKRKLTKEDMARVLDLLETTLVRMTDQELSDLMSCVIPGKVVSAVMHFCVGDNSGAEISCTESHLSSNVQCTPHYQEW